MMRVGRSSVPAQLRCSKHPKHRQSPGVCSMCLREKLFKLLDASSSSNTIVMASSSSSICSSNCSSMSSSPYSSEASSCSSPVGRDRYVKNVSFSMPLSSKNVVKNVRSNSLMGNYDHDGVGGMGILMMMKRSKSVAGLGGRKLRSDRDDDDDDGDGFRRGGEAKKGGFWLKLLLGLGRNNKRRKGNQMVLVVQSNSMREKRAKMV
ncbi:hypothetical protein Scep_018505 [Stephania cephalantha]|uniref:Uncharacterized protein n=1 Tax=Stephania cephalantha TaxID=152367 RepID=A0AAP0I9Z6_9MAGN